MVIKPRAIGPVAAEDFRRLFELIPRRWTEDGRMAGRLEARQIELHLTQLQHRQQQNYLS